MKSYWGQETCLDGIGKMKDGRIGNRSAIDMESEVSIDHCQRKNERNRKISRIVRHSGMK